MAFGVAAPIATIHAQTYSTLSVTSQDLSGSTITGYYTVLFDSSGNVSSQAFTPATFSLTSGADYTVQVDNYGSCNFDHWSDTGSTSASRSISISSDTQITAVYNCGGTSGAGGSASLTIGSTDTSGNAITGYYTALLEGGSVVKTGFTPASFSLVSGGSYSVQVDNYGNCSFAQWSDGVKTNPRPFTADGAMSFTAQYNCGGTTGGGESGAGPGTITIYDHRIPADYWAPCFATSCTNPQASCDTSCTGPGAAMWVALCSDPNCDSVIQTGFSDEGGLTFSNLSPSTTYYLYPADCDLCHNSTHDVLFSNWGDGTATRPLAVVANGTYYDAWYTCTNGCGGG